VLVRLRVKLDNFEAKCKRQLDLLRSAHSDIAAGEHELVVGALRLFMKKTGADPDALFKQLCGDAQEISLRNFKQFLATLQELQVHSDHLEIGLGRYTSGIGKLVFVQMLQDHLVCESETPLTDIPELKDSHTIRNLDSGEIVEVLEAGKLDEAVGVSRVRCRAVRDDTRGWATLRNNQGAVLLRRIPKPYFACFEETAMSEGFARSSATVCILKPGEVVEHTQGPLKEPSQEMQRIRGRSAKDGKTGWVTLREADGSAMFHSTKALVCRAPVTMTTAFDVNQGSAIRKVDIGEAFDIVEGPARDEENQLTRVKAKSKHDAMEGWITMEGNQGSVLLEANDQYYVCRRATNLENDVLVGSAMQRRVDEGEFIELLEGPQTLMKPGLTRLRVRDPRSKREGWLTLSSSNMRAWSPRYRCSSPISLQDVVEVGASKVLRRVEAGEVLEALDIPSEVAGLLRIRARAEKD